MSNLNNIPERVGEKPVTNPVPPHLQHNQHSPRAIYNSLADWMFGSFPKSREHKTLISVPSSRAMWLHEAVTDTPQDGFMPPAHSREFAHLHKDGSIHVCLPDACVAAVLEAKWGEVHPYKHLGVNEILVYAPQDEEELKTLQDVIIASYEFVTGERYSQH